MRSTNELVLLYKWTYAIFALINSKNDVINITQVSLDYKLNYGSKDVSNTEI